MIKNLITKNRTYRRFYQEVAIQHEALRELVDLARLSASAANWQPVHPPTSENHDITTGNMWRFDK